MGKISNSLVGLWMGGASLTLSAAVLIEAKSGEQVCNAVFVQPQKVVVPLHCLPTLDPAQVLISPSPNEKHRQVTRIRSIVDREGYFPSFDIALLHVEEAVIEYTKPGRASGKGIYVLETLRPDQTRKNRIVLKRMADVEGPRVTALTMFEALGSDLPCYGDSGAGVYFEKGKTRTLIGFLTGLSAPLTPSSYDCKDKKRLVTPLAPYQNWIDGGSAPFFPNKATKTSFKSLEDSCRNQGFSSPTWTVIQNLILDLKPSAQQFLRCDGLNPLWDAALKQLLPRKFGEVLNPDDFEFLTAVKSGTFQSVNPNDIKIISKWPGLQSVTLNGTEAGIDLSPLGDLHQLRQLKLMHSQGFRGLENAAKKWKYLEIIDIFNSTAASSGELESIQKKLPRVQVIRDQIRKAE